MADDELDDVWDKLNDDSSGEASSDEAVVIEAGPPVQVTVVIRADRIPVAPWAQGWRVGAIGPDDGHVTLLFEHDIDATPVAQLSAITGLLATVKAARLELVWWALQARAPLPLEGGASGEPDLDQELADLLANRPPEDADDAR